MTRLHIYYFVAILAVFFATAGMAVAIIATRAANNKIAEYNELIENNECAKLVEAKDVCNYGYEEGDIIWWCECKPQFKESVY